MKIKKLLMISLSAFCCLPSFLGAAGVLNLTATVDMDNEANTSGTTAYEANNQDDDSGDPAPTTQATGPAGFSSAAGPQTQTFNFVDTKTGITFSYDLTVSTNGGNVSAFGSSLGVVGNADAAINGTEEMTVTVSNMSIDLSGYIAGSFCGLPSVSLDTTQGGGDGFGFGLQFIAFENYTIADSTLSVATDGFTNASHTDDDNGFNIGTGGNLDGGSFPNIDTDGNFFTVSVAAGSTDPSVRIGGTITRVSLALIPEPSTSLLVALSGAFFIAGRKRKS